MPDRIRRRTGSCRFSWEGQEELDPAFGRGWALIEKDELHGRIFFHQGDESAFLAMKDKLP